MQSQHRLYLLIPFLFFCFGFSTCTTSQQVETIGKRNYQNAFSEANRYFQLGQYNRAMLKYTAYIYSPYPNKKNLEEARYRLAVTHMMLDQPHETYTTAQNFLEKYPDSNWADNAQELLEKAKSKIQAQQQELKQQEQSLMKQIAQLEQSISEKESVNSNTYMKLADKYWNAGKIQESIDAYEKAAEKNPEHLQDSQLRSRVRITDNGEFKVRDPMLDFEKDETVKVINAELQRVRRENFLGEFVALRYSGKVRNTGLYDVHNVQLEVAVYDSFERLQDTRVIPIGTIPAGQERPFAVMLNRYSGLAIDVTKVETQVYYDQP